MAGSQAGWQRTTAPARPASPQRQAACRAASSALRITACLTHPLRAHTQRQVRTRREEVVLAAAKEHVGAVARRLHALRPQPLQLGAAPRPAGSGSAVGWWLVAGREGRKAYTRPAVAVHGSMRGARPLARQPGGGLSEAHPPHTHTHLKRRSIASPSTSYRSSSAAPVHRLPNSSEMSWATVSEAPPP